MRRTAFVGVLSTGILASAWFAAQSLADPYRPAPAETANSDVAHPDVPSLTEIGSTLEVAMIQPSQSELAAALENALLGDECPTEDAAMVKIINATAGVHHEVAAAAIEQVSAQAHNCASVDVALGRTRGVAEQAKPPETPQPPANEPAFFGTGAPVGGEGGPGYRHG